MTPPEIIDRAIGTSGANRVLAALKEEGYVVRRRWCWKNFLAGKIVGIILGKVLLG